MNRSQARLSRGFLSLSSKLSEVSSTEWSKKCVDTLQLCLGRLESVPSVY
jgi:hypothetical protein